MDRIFRRIAFVGAIVTIIGAGALSGTYAKTGELRFAWLAPQSSAATMLTEGNQTALLRPASLSLQHGPAGRPLRIVENELDDHPLPGDQSLKFSDTGTQDIVEPPYSPTNIQSKRKTWQLSAAPELVPRGLPLTVTKPINVGETSSVIASKELAISTPRAAQPKPVAGPQRLVEAPHASGGEPRLAARAVQPDPVAVNQVLAPRPARKPSIQPAERSRVKGQRVVSKPSRSLPAISRQRFELVARISNEHIRYGIDLAARGATRSARQEFLDVLNRVSQALDHTSGNHQYSQALNAGLKALHEAEDFQTGHSRLSTDVDLKILVATHQTQAFKNIAEFQHLTPVMAMQSYLEYAKEQLVFASGQQQVASRALYGLARLETLQPQGRPLDKPIRGPRAIALHQAALLVDKGNHAAANELGVLLARYGQLDGAGDILSHAAKLSPKPETWHNLARVYELKGNVQKAAHARTVYQRLLADARNSPGNTNEGRQVYWVAQDAFRSRVDSLDADALQSRMASELAKTVQDSSDETGWSKPRGGSKDNNSRRGPLNQLGRLMKEKFGSRRDVR
jgi:tetratricopeptide (TPR) repeat protein